MSSFITGKELLNAVTNQSFIKNGTEKSVEGVKYDFRLSNHILKAKFGRPVDASKLTQTEKKDLIIEPGEVVFTLTEESLALPSDMIAQLSPKRKMSEGGVITLGGFTIDPGYQGRLLVGLQNVSSTPYPLKPGKKLIAATFLRLDESEKCTMDAFPESLDDFPDSLIDVVQKYQPLSTEFFIRKLDDVQREIDLIKAELDDHKEWQERLDRHDGQIEKMLIGLSEERDERKNGQSELAIAIKGMNKNFAVIKGGALVFYAIIALFLIPFFIQFCPAIIKYLTK